MTNALTGCKKPIAIGGGSRILAALFRWGVNIVQRGERNPQPGDSGILTSKMREISVFFWKKSGFSRVFP
jgi:hypothetical protein